MLHNKYDHHYTRHILYLVYLCPCLSLDLFMSYQCHLFFIFSHILIVIIHITPIKHMHLFYCTFFGIFPIIFDFFFYLDFLSHSRITGLQGNREGISLTPHYHFHPLQKHLDIGRAITAGSSALHIASSRTRTGILWFRSASR